jgi:hypothetical protein
METSEDQDTTPLISRSDVPPKDTRQHYEKQLAVYLILISIFCERVAFYSLAYNLVPTLQSNRTFNWSSQHSTTTSFIFSGKYYCLIT